MSILECFDGLYGESCAFNCSCSTSSVCDSISGNCSCNPGFIGEKCTESKYMHTPIGIPLTREIAIFNMVVASLIHISYGKCFYHQNNN